MIIDNIEYVKKYLEKRAEQENIFYPVNDEGKLKLVESMKSLKTENKELLEDKTLLEDVNAIFKEVNLHLNGDKASSAVERIISEFNEIISDKDKLISENEAVSSEKRELISEKEQAFLEKEKMSFEKLFGIVKKNNPSVEGNDLLRVISDRDVEEYITSEITDNRGEKTISDLLYTAERISGLYESINLGLIKANEYFYNPISDNFYDKVIDIYKTKQPEVSLSKLQNFKDKFKGKELNDEERLQESLKHIRALVQDDDAIPSNPIEMLREFAQNILDSKENEKRKSKTEESSSQSTASSISSVSGTKEELNANENNFDKKTFKHNNNLNSNKYETNIINNNNRLFNNHYVNENLNSNMHETNIINKNNLLFNNHYVNENSKDNVPDKASINTKREKTNVWKKIKQSFKQCCGYK
ncbi:MAG: hypothetical protein K6D38_07020 [Pseudobutyrivibrio sp.]|nr:hypothetical protein [Pseudobutyrivibrio sp.]